MWGKVAVAAVVFLFSSAVYAEEPCTVGETPIMKHKSVMQRGEAIEHVKKLMGVWEGGTWQTPDLCTAVAFIPKSGNEVTVIYSWGGKNAAVGRAGTNTSTSTVEGAKIARYWLANNRQLSFELLPDGSLQGTMIVTGLGTYTTAFTKVPDEKLVAK